MEANDTPQSTAQKPGNGFAALLSRLDGWSARGLRKIFWNLPFVLFLLVLAILHIANSHLADRMVRETVKTEKEVKQLRWYHINAQSDLTQQLKQSEVENMVAAQGLKPLSTPPQKIVVKTDGSK